MYPQLASLSQRLPTGSRRPWREDSPLLIILVAGREVQTGTPKVMENWGGTKQQTVEGRAIIRGSGQPTATTFSNPVV